MINKKKNLYKTPLIMCAFLTIISFSSLTWSKGMKGTLEVNEREFLDKVIFPILIKGGVCKNLQKDCRDTIITCFLLESLTCNMYGVSDPALVKEVLLEVIRSDMAFSKFIFWRSRHENKSFLEAPLVTYTNNLEEYK